MGWDQSSRSPSTPLDWDAFVSRISTSECRSPGVQSVVSDMDAGSRSSTPSTSRRASRTGSDVIEWMSDEAISERASRWGPRVAETVVKNSRRQSSPFGSARISSSSRPRSPTDASEIVPSPRPPDDLENVFSSIRLAFMVCDATNPEARILYASAGFHKLTGYSPEEAVGRTCWFLLEDGIDSDKIGEIQSAVRRGETYSGTMVNYRKDGTQFWNLLNLSPISDDDGVVIKYFGMQTEVECPPEMQRAKRCVHAITVNANEGRNHGILASLSEETPPSALRSDIDLRGTEQRFIVEDEDCFPVFQSSSRTGMEGSDSLRGSNGTVLQVSGCSSGINEARHGYSLNTRPSGRRVTMLDKESDGGESRRHSNRYSLTISPRRSMEFRSRRSMALDLGPSDDRSMEFCSRAWLSESHRFEIAVLERYCSIDTYLEVMPPEVREWYSFMARRSLVLESNSKFVKQGGKSGEAPSPSPNRSRPLLWFLAAERSAEIEETGAHSEYEESQEARSSVSGRVDDGERKLISHQESIRMWRAFMLRMRRHSKAESTSSSILNSMPQLPPLSFRNKSRAMTKFYHSEVRPRWTGLIKAAQNQVASARQSVSYNRPPNTEASRRVVLVHG